MSCRNALPILAAILALSGAAAHAGPITIDGSWGDWGIDPTTGDWDASTGSRIFFEDYTATDGLGFVGPGYGGQFYDVEAIYASRAGNKVWFGMVTGFDPDGVKYGGRTYTAGDLFFDVGNGWKAAIDLETKQVYKDVTSQQPVDYPGSAPFTIKTGTLVGTTLLSVPFDGVVTVDQGNSTTHYFYEGYLDLDTVGGTDQDALLHWTMSCGNDVGEGKISYLGPENTIPEPTTVTLLGMGLAGLALGRRRKA